MDKRYWICEQPEGTPKDTATTTTFVREVTAVYRGARRAVDKMESPESVAAFLRKILPDNSREHFMALYLDGGHKVIAFSVVSTGTANSCHVHPREIFQRAYLTGAVSIIVGHNHPSGQVEPSQEDRKITNQLADVAKILGIKLLDHVIVTDSAFYSLSTGTDF
jgi:DNA repair protein RadC